MDKDVIQPSHSPWSSPIILVRKDGSTHFGIDFRKVNSITKKDAYPLPRVDDTVDTLGGSKIFSTLCERCFRAVSYIIVRLHGRSLCYSEN